MLMLSFSAYGMKSFNVKDGSAVNIEVSSKYLTRIKIKKGRISNIWGMDGSIIIKPDKKSGEIYFRPKPNRKKEFSFFIKDGQSHTYTIKARIVDHADQTIELIPEHRPHLEEATKFKSIPFVKRVKNLIKLMAKNQSSEDCTIDEVNKEVTLWDEVNFIHKKRYLSGKLTGNIFSLKNTTDKDLILGEHEFLSIRPNVRAVAIEKLTLKKNEETLVYIVTY